VLDRTDLDHMFHEIGFRIRSARMVDVARAVPAVGAVDGPAGVDLEQVAGIELVGGFAANLPAAVTNDELPLLDCDPGEETQPSFGSTDPKVTRRGQFRGHEIMICPPTSIGLPSGSAVQRLMLTHNSSAATLASDGVNRPRVRENSGKPRRRKAIHEALRSAPLRL